MKNMTQSIVIVLIMAAVISMVGCSVISMGSRVPAEDKAGNNKPDTEWKILADIPNPQMGCCAAVLRKKLHVIGGCLNDGGASAAHQVYDPASNTWTQKAPLPDKAAWPAVAVWNDKIYIFGGDRKGVYAEETARSFVYDPEKNAWTEIAPLPKPRSHFAAAAAGPFIYIFGGRADRRDLEPDLSTYRYDPEESTYERMADIPEAAMFINSGYYQGRIFVIHGQTNWDRQTDAETYADGVLMYDILHDTWTKQEVRRPIKAIWYATQHSANIVWGSRLYVAGGKPPEVPMAWRHEKEEEAKRKAFGENQKTRTDKIWYLDMKTKEFGEDVSPMPEGRCCAAAGIIAGITDGTIYVAGGFKDEYFLNGWRDLAMIKATWSLKLPEAE